MINILQLNEVRKAHFLKVFNRKPEDMQIISFGKFNYNCPYCKRDGQFKNENGNIIYSYDITMEQIRKVIDTVKKMVEIAKTEGMEKAKSFLYNLA